MVARNPVLRCLHHWPTRALCIVLTLLQAASLNWYLMEHLSYNWAAMYAADAVVIAMFIISFIMSTTVMHSEKKTENLSFSDSRHQPMTYVAWFVYAAVLDIKVGVIFSEFSTDLDEVYFFGPNTCKTTLALAGLIFITFLNTQHNAMGNNRKALILTLTATVLVDVLDGVDNIDPLFDKDVRDTFPPGLDNAMIAICCINFLLPTIPLVTLSVTRFGLHPLPEKLETLHKLLLAYLVNLPLFITRMITWHGLSQGISIFSLKNIIVMGVVTFEVLEKWYVEEEKEREEEEFNKIERGNKAIEHHRDSKIWMVHYMHLVKRGIENDYVKMTWSL